MKALIIGGTGIISTAITQKLVADGHDVTLLNRGNNPLPKGAKSLIADANDEPAVKQAISGLSFDSVAQFKAFVPEQAERDVRLFSGVTGQYIFISSASAYQKPIAHLPITESTPLHNPYWQYSRDKAACEELLMAAYRDAGFPVTIVRPSHTYSRISVPLSVHGDKGPWQVLRRMLAGKPVIIPGDGSNIWAVTDSRDFARGFVGLMGNPHALGQAVQIMSGELLTWNDIYGSVARALGVEMVPAYIPSEMLAKAGEEAGYDLRGGLLGDKAHSVIFDCSKLKRLVPGWTARIRFDEGVRESVDYFLSHPDMQEADPEFDAFCDRMIAAMERV
ncbi:MAG: SDR family oxidoreductase [Oscillospiraceae bacterium]|nr:SDR family oxidoreductase [Oscillospiraceae bacterium]